MSQRTLPLGWTRADAADIFWGATFSVPILLLLLASFTWNMPKQVLEATRVQKPKPTIAPPQVQEADAEDKEKADAKEE